MHLKFESIYVDGFQSLNEETIILDDAGIVLVKGRNNYDSRTESNGAGKSSIFESILFAIYGKTSSGIINPSNRILNTGCHVTLKLSIGNDLYSISRSINHHRYGTSVKVLKNDIDISRRNKSDNQSLILEIIGCSQDIFTSVIYMNQGLSGRLSLLSPSGRKARLEELSGISDKVNKFKQQLQTYSNSISSEMSSVTVDISKQTGILSYAKESLIRNKELIRRSKEDKKLELESLNKKLSVLKEELSNLLKQKSCVSESLVSSRKKYEALDSIIKSDRNSLTALESKYKNVHIDGENCPICGNKLSKEEFEKLCSENDRECSKISEHISKLFPKWNEVCASVSELETDAKSLDTLISKKNSEIAVCESSIESTSLKTDISNINLDHDIQTIKSCKETISELNKNYESLSSRKDVSDNILFYITKDFRMWLLNNVISFLNERLEHYSKLIFENDIVSISEDSNKIEISVGESKYESLSGGEKRRADLAVLLAQRDLAATTSGISSNILVLDEVFDNLDSEGISTLSEVFTSECKDASSVYVISHKSDVNIPYDSIMLVVKEANKISRIERTI